MSAMLEFYDDGEECDETTEEDLEYLKDVSTRVNLGVRLSLIIGILKEILCTCGQERRRLSPWVPKRTAEG